MFHGTAHVILGSGLTIAGAMFCLHFTRCPMFQLAGHPAGHRHDRRGARRADARARRRHGGQPFRRCWNPSAPCGSGSGASIGAAVVRWPGPILIATIGAVADRSARAARLPHQLQRPALPAAGHPGQRGLRGRRTALPRGAAEPGAADDRERPRSAQLGGLPGDRQDRQGDLPPVPGIGRVQTITRPQGTPIEHTLDPVHDRACRAPRRQLNQKYLQDRMADMLKQGDDMNVTIDTMDADVRPDGRAQRRHPRHGRQDGHDAGRHRRTCATTSPTSTTSSGRSATTSTGNRTASTSRCAGRSARCSTPSTASTR